MPLKDFISTDYQAVHEDTSLQDIINTIDYQNYNIIPVINARSEIMGFLTKSRLLFVLSRQYQDQSTEKEGVLA